MDSLKGHRRALFLILDDINDLAGSEEFANWLKSMVDEIATSLSGTYRSAFSSSDLRNDAGNW